MHLFRSLAGGLAGAIALTISHQLLRRYVSDAPRMDLLGKQGLEKLIKASGYRLPSQTTLQAGTLAGDIAGNALYYAMAGIKPKAGLLAGAALGLAAGMGAVGLPDKLGLDPVYSNKSNTTRWLTIGLYLTGGLVAGAIYTITANKHHAGSKL